MVHNIEKAGRFFVLLLLLGSMSVVCLGSDDVKLQGLSKEVTVRRDARSIPYINAANEADLYFMQGYVTAKDRLWQMDLMRRLAGGRTAELFGTAALEQDKLWRRYGFASIVEESAARLEPDLKACLESYARGVNAYIDSLDDRSLPVEFQILRYRPEHWKPTDSLMIGKILAEALSSTWRLDLLQAQLTAALPKDKLAAILKKQTPYDVVLFGGDKGVASANISTGKTVPDRIIASADQLENVRKASLEMVGLYAEDLAASNNWVVAGSRTADGVPLLANDPHLQPTAPGIWYMSFLESPEVKVAGVTFPGVPGIVLGHNDSIAWGATNVGPDVQDIFIETFDASGKVKTAEGWKPAKIRNEVIDVRTNILKAETHPVSFAVTETPNGVIILEDGDRRYSLKWTARDPVNNDIAAFYRLDRARNWDEFKHALSSYRGASQNFVFADKKHIGWHIAGGIPIRRAGDGSTPYDGSSTDGDWVGYIPFDDLPQLFDPPSGFIVTANQRTIGADYKYQTIARDIAAPWRARRLLDLLSADKKLTMDRISEIQHDAYNIPLRSLANDISAAGAGSSEIKKMLADWDGMMMPDSQAALWVNEVRLCLANKIADENKPIPAALIRERILTLATKTEDPMWLPRAFRSYSDLYNACGSDVDADLTKRYGPDRTKWTWSQYWVSKFTHPLAAAPLIGGQFAAPSVPIPGSGQSPNVGSAVSMRFIASPGNWDLTRHVIPLGQSGDPRSPYFKDQFQAWLTGKDVIFPFSRVGVERSTVSVQKFTP